MVSLFVGSDKCQRPDQDAAAKELTGMRIARERFFAFQVEDGRFVCQEIVLTFDAKVIISPQLQI